MWPTVRDYRAKYSAQEDLLSTKPSRSRSTDQSMCGTVARGYNFNIGNSTTHLTEDLLSQLCGIISKSGFGTFPLCSILTIFKAPILWNGYLIVQWRNPRSQVAIFNYNFVELHSLEIRQEHWENLNSTDGDI